MHAGRSGVRGLQRLLGDPSEPWGSRGRWAEPLRGGLKGPQDPTWFCSRMHWQTVSNTRFFSGADMALIWLTSTDSQGGLPLGGWPVIRLPRRSAGQRAERWGPPCSSGQGRLPAPGPAGPPIHTDPTVFLTRCLQGEQPGTCRRGGQKPRWVVTGRAVSPGGAQGPGGKGRAKLGPGGRRPRSGWSPGAEDPPGPTRLLRAAVRPPAGGGLLSGPRCRGGTGEDARGLARGLGAREPAGGFMRVGRTGSLVSDTCTDRNDQYPSDQEKRLCSRAPGGPGPAGPLPVTLSPDTLPPTLPRPSPWACACLKGEPALGVPARPTPGPGTAPS